tara:strand:+ start:1067 stop:1783 length:717 start_codon:yes stop_codon:yes gene_type:complete
MAVWAFVPAAGSGVRMGVMTPKQYLMLHNRPLLWWTLDRLSCQPEVTGVLVGISADDSYWSDLKWHSGKMIGTVNGGDDRARTVLNGVEKLLEVGESEDWVLVHDAVRPCVTNNDISRLIAEVVASECRGGLLGAPIADTIKQVSKHRVRTTVDRSQLWRALTPQLFPLGLLHQALSNAIKEGVAITDEASAVERVGFPPLMVEGRSDNIKITHPGDLQLAEVILASQESVDRSEEDR